MKAIVYRRYGGPEVLTDGDVPVPTPGPGQVRVRVHAASINAADYRLMRADPFLVRLMNGLSRPKKHTCLGVDVAGVVDAVGPGVQRHAVGDAVFGDAWPDGMGAFAEYACISESLLVAKPDNVSFAEAAAVPLAGITALQGLRDIARVRSGQSVLVQGAGGGVGSFAVQLAKALGAEVTAVCGAGSAELARACGADHVLDYAREDFTRAGKTYDVILGVNGYHPLAAYKHCLEPGGAYVMIGGGNRQLFEALLLGRLRFAFSGRRMGTLNIADARRADDLRQLRDMLAGGQLTPYIDRTFPLAQLADAMRYVEGGHVRGKVVVTVGEG